MSMWQKDKGLLSKITALPLCGALPRVLDSRRESSPMATVPSSGLVRFGVFEINLASGELRKQGVRIKLHEQPFKVLVMLAERQGQVVSREELCQRLWPENVFLDSDVGLNSAIMKLRAALGDSAENPRFVETLPRRGYRLIVGVENIGAQNRANSVSDGLSRSQEGWGPAVAVDQSLGPQEVDVIDPPEKARPRRTKATAKMRLSLKVALVAALVAFAAITSWLALRHKSSHYVIAVLPLKNLNPEQGSDYFSDGLTDEIISNLSVIDGLQVKSQTSSFALKNKQNDLHTVGTQLGVNLVLEGSVLRVDNKLRVDVQLVRVSDDNSVWSGSYERQLSDVFAVQNEISRSIVDQLRLKLGRGQRRYNTNLEAYDLYLRARALANRYPGSGSEKIAASIPLFEATIAKDPNFAPAYAGIADAYAYLSATPRTFAPAAAYPKMREACEKALQLDPLLADAHACMGVIHARDYAWPDAEKDFRETFQLNPNLSRPHQDYAIYVLFPLGRLREAEKEMYKSLELDPLSSAAINYMNMVLLSDRRDDEVMENSLRALKTDPENYGARQSYARALVQKGRLSEGIAILEKLGVGSESFLGYAYAKAGRRADAEQIAIKYKTWPWLQAIVYAGLGDKDRAIEGLEDMAAIRDPRFGSYPRYPELVLLRGDSRLNEIRRTVGLPEIH